MSKNAGLRILHLPTAVALIGLLAACAGQTPVRSEPAAEAAGSGPAEFGEDPAQRYNSIMRVARHSEKGKDLTIAIGLYQRAHEIDPTQTAPLVRLATLYQKTGHDAQAAEAYRRLSRLEPKNPDHLLQYGKLLLRAERTEEAQRQFHRALKLEENPQILNALGVTYDLAGERGEAQAYYRSALDLDPSYLPAMGNLGLSLALSGDHQAGIEVLEGTVAMATSGPEHRRMLATAYGLSGDMAAASQVSGTAFDEVALRENLIIYGAAE